MDVKLAVIYYSATGAVDTMARRGAATAEKAGAEVRLRQVEEIAPAEAIDAVDEWREHVDATNDEPTATPEDIVWADAVLLGSPSRFGNIACQLEQYLDALGPQWASANLADKVYAGFATDQTIHGGQESTLLALYNTVQHFGGILVAPGYPDEVKYAAGPDHDAPVGDVEEAALDHLVDRVLDVARRLIAATTEENPWHTE